MGLELSSAHADVAPVASRGCADRIREKGRTMSEHGSYQAASAAPPAYSFGLPRRSASEQLAGGVGAPPPPQVFQPLPAPTDPPGPIPARAPRSPPTTKNNATAFSASASPRPKSQASTRPFRDPRSPGVPDPSNRSTRSRSRSPADRSLRAQSPNAKLKRADLRLASTAVARTLAHSTALALAAEEDVNHSGRV